MAISRIIKCGLCGRGVAPGDPVNAYIGVKKREGSMRFGFFWRKTICCGRAPCNPFGINEAHGRWTGTKFVRGTWTKEGVFVAK